MVAYLILILVAIYFVWIVFMVLSWNTTKPYALKGKSCDISVIIPFRNEEKNLGLLCRTLKAQEHVHGTVEYIFVDDHSTDFGAEKIDKSLPHQLIKLGGNKGKKKAIEEGVNVARYDVIVTIDADVIPPITWLSTISDAMASTQADLLIMPVEISPGQNTFGILQSLEFMSLTGITGGSALLKNPIMCNGANLAFKKNSWITANQNRSDHNLASGDDMFLLHALKKNGNVQWLHHRGALVKTIALQKLSEFIEQRIRWTSKSKSFKDRGTLIFGALILAVQCTILYSFIIALTKNGSWATFIWVVLFKSIVDFLLLHAVAKWSGRTKLLIYFPLLVILHPLYVAITIVGSLVYRPKWKERKI